MIAVIFEVLPHPHTKQTYLDMAASLRPRLDRIDGFSSIERFQSLTDPDKILSLSFFRDEEAVTSRCSICLRLRRGAADWRAIERYSFLERR
jgi:heme-degrading monooxygenase HmoA